MNTAFFNVIAGHLAVDLDARYRELERLKDLAVFLKTEELQFEKQLESLGEELKEGATAGAEFENARKRFLECRQEVDDYRVKAEKVRDQLSKAGNPLFYAILSYVSPYTNPPLDQLKARYHKCVRRTRDAEDRMDDARQSYLTAKDNFERTQGAVDNVVFALRSSARDYNDTMDAMVSIHQEIDELIQRAVLNTPVPFYFRHSADLQLCPELIEAILRLKRALIWKRHLGTYVVPAQPDDETQRFLKTGDDAAVAVESAFREHTSTLKGSISFSGQGTAHKKKTSRVGNTTRTYWKKIDIRLSGPVSIVKKWSYRLWNQCTLPRIVATSAHRHYMTGMKHVLQEERFPSVAELEKDIVGLTARIRSVWEEEPATTSP